MAYYKKFEELPCWQNARKLAAQADQVIESSLIKRNFKMRDQMLGSSGSIMDNIAEGFDRRSKPEFVRFLFYSKVQAPNSVLNFTVRWTLEEYLKMISIL
jgi:hypothetical protein